jgi:hypothetical protein
VKLRSNWRDRTGAAGSRLVAGPGRRRAGRQPKFGCAIFVESEAGALRMD